MNHKLFTLIALLFLSLCAPASAVWIGVKNDMDVPVRLVSVLFTSTTTGKAYPLLLGSFDSESETHWYHIQDSTIWEVSVFALVEKTSLVRYSLRRNNDSHHFRIAKLDGDVFLFTFAKDGHVDMSKPAALPDGDFKVKEPIWNICLADEFSILAQGDINLGRTMAEEATVLDLLAGGINQIEIPKLELSSGIGRYCYMEGYRNGWFSAVFPVLEKHEIDLYMFFSTLVSEDKTLRDDLKLWKSLLDGYTTGRENALKFLKKHGY